MHADEYLKEVASIAAQLDRDAIENLAKALLKVRFDAARVFVIGLGGSYSNAEHFAADLRKLCEIEAYAPNVAEMSAWINDEGSNFAFDGHFRHMTSRDVLFVLSVGGGTSVVSYSIVRAIERVRAEGCEVYAIVGPDGGYSARNAKIAIKVPAPLTRVTPHTEAFQAVIWHCLVSHPLLQRAKTKW